MTQHSESPLDEVRTSSDVYARYHQRRRGFYMFLDRLVKGVSVLAGSAAAAALSQTVVAYPGVGQWLLIGGAVSVALLNAWDLVVGFPDRAREHEDLRRKYVELLVDIEKLIARPVEDERVAEVRSRFLAIGVNESPTFWAIYAQCWNQVAIAADKRYRLVRLPRWKLYAGYIFRMHENTFPPASGQKA